MPSPAPPVLAAVLSLALTPAAAAPTVYPTGTTIYQPEQSWNGYTVLSVLDTPAVLVIDMNGTVVRQWEGYNLSAGGPARVLPGGSVIAPAGVNEGHQEAASLVRRDFHGMQEWTYSGAEAVSPAPGAARNARQHHDWQLSDFPAGYYSPGNSPSGGPGTRTLLLTHTSHHDQAISDTLLEDDRLIEISDAGTVLWEWRAADHIDEFGLGTEAREAIRNIAASRESYDWSHINSATYLGPNRWFDAGDERFAPDNVIISSRHAGFIAIVARDGSIVWRLGPDYSRSPEASAIGQVIGQHHAHLIPPGLPGAGNLLLFDNGGSSGYGAPSPIAPGGLGLYARATSRILEINPATLELVWSYRNPNFFSTNISSAQRLANGNTLITEGAPGRLFEVDREGEIVWEYMNPPSTHGRGSNPVYRAYRIPYNWIPQLPVPTERRVTAPPPEQFTLPAGDPQ